MQSLYDRDQFQQQENGFGRRVFLSRMMAGAGGAAFVPGGRALADTEADPVCKPSAADSLILYLDLLSEIQFQATKTLFTKVVVLLKSCQQLFDEVYEQVKILEAELNKSQLKVQARQMRDLAEAGRANARLMRDYLGISGTVEYASLNALAVVGERVAQTAQEMVPKGELVLSSEGAEALKKIIKLVKTYKEEQGKTTTAQSDHREALDNIHKEILEIRKLLFSASVAIARAEEPNVTGGAAAELRSEANKSISKAIEILKRLPQAPAEQADDAPPRDTLVTLLEGTKKWNSNTELAESTSTRGTFQAEFVRVASYRSFTVAKEHRQRVRVALNNHCGPSSIIRVLYCLSLVIPIWVLFASPDERLPMIENVLDLFPCPSGGSKSDLAISLAQIQL